MYKLDVLERLYAEQVGWTNKALAMEFGCRETDAGALIRRLERQALVIRDEDPATGRRRAWLTQRGVERIAFLRRRQAVLAAEAEEMERQARRAAMWTNPAR